MTSLAPVLAALALAASLPPGLADEKPREAPCCDAFEYAVEVHYATGDMVTLGTFDGDTGPAHDLAVAVLAATLN